MYKRNREKIVSIQEMNKLLAYVAKNYLLVDGDKESPNFSRYAYYINNQVNFRITFKKGSMFVHICVEKMETDNFNLLKDRMHLEY